MNFFARILLNISIGFLSYFVPKNKSQILLGSENGYAFMDNSKYFYLYLLKNLEQSKFKKIFWITKSEKVFSELNEMNLPVVKLYSLKGFITILRSKFIITTHIANDVSYFFRLPGRLNKIQALHGAPFKGILTNPTKKWINQLSNYLFEKERNSYKTIISTTNKTKKFEIAYKNFTVLGCPRNDIFFNHSYILKDYQKNLELNKYSKVILFAPTFRDKNTSKISFSNNFLEKLNEYLKNENSILLLKEHYWGRSNIYINKFSNILDVSKIVDDVFPLLIHVDVFITDYSSLVMDFLLLNKPIIFYPYDFEEYTKIRQLFVNYFYDLPGPFVKNEEELFECLKSIEHNFKNPEYQKKFLDFKNKYHKFQDGKSCDRLYDYLIQGL